MHTYLVLVAVIGSKACLRSFRLDGDYLDVEQDDQRLRLYSIVRHLFGIDLHDASEVMVTQFDTNAEAQAFMSDAAATLVAVEQANQAAIRPACFVCN